MNFQIMNLQKSKTNLAKHDPYIKFIDRHGQTYIYVANIDVLAQEYERRTGYELCWRCEAAAQTEVVKN